MSDPAADEEVRLRAALAALGVEVPAALWQARSEDAGLRRAALWALLRRAAGDGMSRATAGPGNDYGYYVSAWEWPAEDQARRAVEELDFTHVRVEQMATTVAPWSVAVSTGYEGEPEVDGWATPAAYAIEAAAYLLRWNGPGGSGKAALDACVRSLARCQEYLERLTEAIGE